MSIFLIIGLILMTLKLCGIIALSWLAITLVAVLTLVFLVLGSVFGVTVRKRVWR